MHTIQQCCERDTICFLILREKTHIFFVCFHCHTYHGPKQAMQSCCSYKAKLCNSRKYAFSNTVGDNIGMLEINQCYQLRRIQVLAPILDNNTCLYLLQPQLIGLVTLRICMRPIHLTQIILLNMPILLVCNYLKKIISALVANNKSNKSILLLVYVALAAPFTNFLPQQNCTYVQSGSQRITLSTYDDILRQIVKKRTQSLHKTSSFYSIQYYI